MYTIVYKIDKRRATLIWRCWMRNRNVTCCATVSQQGDVFIRRGNHVCASAELGRDVVAIIRRDCKLMAKERPFASASVINNEVIHCKNTMMFIAQLL